jgi:hypothetical protein
VWLAWLIYVHRWLGIAGCLLFIAWFISGIAMMYVRMPTVTPDERSLHAEKLDLTALAVTPVQAAATAKARSAANAELGMLLGRPVYRFTGRAPVVVFADNGTKFASLSKDDAMRVAREWSPKDSATMRYAEQLSIVDQWTIQYRQHMPIHEVLLGDAADTRLYISNTTGEVVVDATRSERFWGYIGPVMHWLYLPVLRRNGPLWTKVIIWSSGIGCVMCILGLVVGLFRFSPSARFRPRQGGTRTPYSGMMKWHHYAGLIFGVITLTWTFSGLMSMGPFSWLDDGPEPDALRTTITGKPDYPAISADGLRAAYAGISRDITTPNLTLTSFRGEPYWQADAVPTTLEHERGWTQSNARAHRLISATHPEAGAFARFDNATIEQLSRDAMPGVKVIDATWLNEYDNYYLHRTGERALPVYRVRYADEKHTWVYYDPQRGAAPLVSRTKDREERWLYQGLHSLSLPVFYFRRPLWDVVTILLLIGGTALGVTTLMPAWKRLRRKVKGFAQRLRGPATS